MTTECKGKQSLPYLLSTTKTLARCQHYFYKFLDFKFNCRHNRDCYTERNVRINMTRMWHNVVLPNAILCREYGKPTTFTEALEALDYAMTHGKTRRSLEMWSYVCHLENEAYKKDRFNSVIFKYQKSFYFYALGRAVGKDGKVYALPKKKCIDIRTYAGKVTEKFIWHRSSMWVCPWDDLNTLIYEWIHYEDEYNERSSARQKRIDELDDKIKWEKAFMADVKKYEEEKAMLEKEDDEDESPEFPTTLRAICDEFHVSMTCAQRFKLWRRQCCKERSDEYFAKSVYWTLPKSKSQSSKQDEDFIDTDDVNKKPTDTSADDEENKDDDLEPNIDEDITSVENSGERPIGNLDEDNELPWLA